MKNDRKVFFHGGSSLITKFLIKKFLNDFDEFYIFCRDKLKTEKILEINNLSKSKKFFIFENDLKDLDKSLEDIRKLPNDFAGIFWISGYTGNQDLEYEEHNHALNNLRVNFLNPTICISELSKKMINNENSFICAITSVAGLRGRGKRLYYSSAKSGLISFLSGLRQKLNKKIMVHTIIPGYISTNSFTEKGPGILICSPEKAANIICKGIKSKKEIIYINNLWRVIMNIISLIPEKIFKKLSF